MKVRRSHKRKSKEILVYYCNLNGIKSKQVSLQQLINQLDPKIIALCETKLGDDKLLRKLLPNYSINSRPNKTGKSGIALAIKSQTFNSVLEVTSTPHKDILVVRVGMDATSLRMILVYAPQETDDVETRENFFTELEIEVINCKMNGDFPIVLGDLNAKIEQNDKRVVPLSANGKLLKGIVENQQLTVLNFAENCTGKWTHVIRTTGKSSVLDYVMIGNEAYLYVKEVTIDEDCVFCPFATKKNKIQYSDHNAIITTLSVSHTRKKPQHRQSWRITEEGLKDFAESCLDLPTLNHISDTKEKYNLFEKSIHNKMDQCFHRHKPKRQLNLPGPHKTIYKQAMAFAKQGKAQRKVARVYIQAMVKVNTERAAFQTRENVKNTLQDLTINNTFSPNKFWNLCKKSRGKGADMGTSIVSDSGVEIFGDEMILGAYKDEFQHRLRQREIIPELQNYQERRKLLCDYYVEEAKLVKQEPYSSDELAKAKLKLKKKKATGLDSIPAEIYLTENENLDNLVLHILNSIKDAHVIPDQWTNVIISTLYKNKGSKKMLINYRGIFLKQVLSKIFERLNMNRIEDKVQNIDKTQAGSRSERSTADQTFLLRSGIDHSKFLDKPLYITLYDFSQCFDSLWLDDCILSLHKLGINNEVLSLIKSLNSESNITVKTPAGITDEFRIDNIVQQGSVCGGILCSASTGEMNANLPAGGAQIGLSNIRCLTFVDDIATMNHTLQDAYNAHERVVWFSKIKRLTLNVKKCMLMCVDARATSALPQLKIDGEKLEVKEVVTYLGDIFNRKGNNYDLIQDRVKKGKSCIVNSMSLCSDITMGMFAIETLLLLYKGLFLQIVLYNAQAWTNLNNMDKTNLQTVQLKFLKRMFHAPSSTSNCRTFLETGVIPIIHEVHIKQLTFLYHILSLPEDDPVKINYSEQKKFPAYNWANEVAALLKKYEIETEEDEIIEHSKLSWKRLVKSKVRKHAFEVLVRDAAEQKNPIDSSSYLSMCQQPYLTDLSPAQARIIFHLRTNTIDLKTVRKYQYAENTMCRLCNAEEETATHVVNKCPDIPREREIPNVYTTNCDQLKQIAGRLSKFYDLIDSRHNDAVDA